MTAFNESCRAARVLVRSCLAAAALTSLAPNAAAYTYDCFDVAAAYQGVRVGILRAIAIRENPRCDGTVSVNKNKSIDKGCMQINSVHYEELAKHGVTPEDLDDQCKNIFVGAWHYRGKIDKHGNTWKAVGAYHSETPDKRDAYAEEVRKIYFRYRKQIEPQ